MIQSGGLDTAAKKVVDAGNCSGRGACARLVPRLNPELVVQGFLHPIRCSPELLACACAEVLHQFESSFPGVFVNPHRLSGSRHHPQVGHALPAWEACVADPQTRRIGSSEGTLTALSIWMLKNSEASRLVGAQLTPSNPTRTEKCQASSLGSGFLCSLFLDPVS